MYVLNYCCSRREGRESREEKVFLLCTKMQSFKVLILINLIKSVVKTPKSVSQLTAFKFECGVRRSLISRLIVLEIQGQNLMYLSLNIFVVFVK